MNTIVVNFYDYYGEQYSQQTVYTEDVVEDLSLKELHIDYGVTIPTLEDIGTLSFILWVKFPTKFNDNVATFTFRPEYKNTDLAFKWMNRQLDIVEENIGVHDNNINIHKYEHDNIIFLEDKGISSLIAEDIHIANEIGVAESSYNYNFNRISNIYNKDFDSQLSHIYESTDEIQCDILEMDTTHMEELYGLNLRTSSDAERLIPIQQKIISTPQQYVISQSEYDNMNRKDENVIYMTKIIS